MNPKTKLLITELHNHAIAKDDAGTEVYIAPSSLADLPVVYHGATLLAIVKTNPVIGRRPIATELELYAEI